jgi:hypothetical protein
MTGIYLFFSELVARRCFVKQPGLDIIPEIPIRRHVGQGRAEHASSWFESVDQQWNA